MTAAATIALLISCRSEPIVLPTDTAPPAEDDTAPEVVSSEGCGACGGDCLLEELAYSAWNHTTAPVDYADRPPAGGPHDPCWAPFGVHPEPVPDDNWVHNLEHGGVIFLYREAEPSAVQALEALAEEKGAFVLVTPYPEMDAAHAAVSWGFRMTAGCLDLEAFGAFYDEHVDRAPESLSGDPGSSCP